MQTFCVNPSALTPRISIDQPISGFAMEEAFAGVKFFQPVGIVVPPGETNRLFVVEKPGIISVITNLAAPTRSVFLDLTATTDSSVEGGLLGLAFHPGFATNGYFFVYRTAANSGYYDQLSRFKVSATDRNVADPAETVILAQPDLAPTHNAGGLEFGPDGYLYLSIGDETPLPEDKPDYGQAIDKGLFGCIIRIDVDKRPGNLPPNLHRGVTDNYLIPADNPWVGATSFMGQTVNPDLVRTELYAIGLRNPWRITFDPLTGKLIAADVGEGEAEEIDDVMKGGNYGWPFYEAVFPGPLAAPSDLNVQFPVHYYEHLRGTTNGTCVIGGVVCRNGSNPLLEGSYVFGDGRSGNIWALKADDFGKDGVTSTWLASNPGTVAYGRDPRKGDVLMANFIVGSIQRLIYVDPAAKRIPQTLSESGLFTDITSLSPAEGLVSYSINASFWSDNAIKKRWFGMTDPSKKIGFSEEGVWNFPTGSIWVKHFDLEMTKGDSATARHVETRVLVKNDTGIHGFTYRWNDAQTDAQLVDAAGAEQTFAIVDSGQVRTQTWQFPARANCNTCHTDAGGLVLGFNTAQLNRTNSTGMNQLAMLDMLGYLDRTPSSSDSLRQLANPRDESQPLEHRVKSYLSANCSQCHQPSRQWIAQWDARLTTPMSDQNIINGVSGGPLTPNARIIVPGSLPDSMIYAHMSDTGLIRMPPLGSTVLDDSARAMIADWITTMPEPGWTTVDIGAGPCRGSLVQRTNFFAVTGTGVGQSFSFSHRVLSNNFQITARLKSMPAKNPGMWAGLMVRSSTNADMSFGSITFGDAGTDTFTGYDKDVDQVVSSSTDPLASWKRLVREGNVFSGWESRDGKSWKLVGSGTVSFPDTVFGGFAVASGNPLRYATAEFDSYTTTSIRLRSPIYDSNSPVPLSVQLTADVANYGGSVQRVDFYADGHLIGSQSADPWSLTWTNAMAGTHELKAAAVDATGLYVWSDPVNVALKPAASAATLLAENTLVDSHWTNTFGNIGYALPLVRTNFPAGTSFAIDGAGAGKWTITWPALDNPLGGLAASAWYNSEAFSIRLQPPFENPYKVTILIADYFKQGTKAQLSVISSQNGAILDERTEQNFGAGKYVSWVVRGPIAISISSLNDDSVHVGGIFLDPLQPAQIAIDSPLDGDYILLPATINLRAQATVKDLPVQSVAFYDGPTLIGKAGGPPFEFPWAGAIAGDHQVTAQAIGPFGIQATSPPVTIHCQLPAAAATFAGTDATIGGEWMSSFGHDAFGLASGPMMQSPVARIALGGDVGVWVPDTGGKDPRGPRILGSDFHIAAYWTSGTTVSFEVDLLDGVQHLIALYIVNYWNGTIPETIRLEDADTGLEIDEQNADDVAAGLYYVWNAQGRIRVTLIRREPWTPPALSAIFVGGPVPPAYDWWARNFSDPYNTPPDWNADPDTDGRSNLMEYAMQSDPHAPDQPVGIQVSSDDQYLYVSADLPTLPPDVRVSLEESTDLQTWESAISDQTNATKTDTASYAIPYTNNTPGPKFFRLRVDLLSAPER